MSKKKFDKEKQELLKEVRNRRTRVKHLRGRKKLGPKSGMKKDRGKY